MITSSALWTRENLAWLAGLLEGEGSFNVRKSKRGNWQLSVTIKMTDQDVIERVKTVTGGTNRITVYQYKDGIRKDSYMFLVTGNREAAALMWAVYPWMCSRRQAKIRECIRIWRASPGRDGRVGRPDCIRGHPLNERRQCPTCRREARKRYKERQRVHNAR